MYKIEPTIATFKQAAKLPERETVSNNRHEKKNDGKKSALVSSLAGLAVIGAAAVGLKRTAKMSYEEALKKNGIEIKNGIATLIETGEKYTGKVQRYDTRNRRETVEFANGVIKEKIYHNLFGREMDGYFYKDGVLRLSVSPHYGTKRKAFGFGEHDLNGRLTTLGGSGGEMGSVFEWARKCLKNIN